MVTIEDALPAGANIIGGVTQSGTWTVQPGNTANTTAWKVDGSAVTQPVSASSLPLPTGAATSALQTTANTSLAAIDAGIPTALGQTTSSASMPVVIASDQSTLPVLAIPVDGQKKTFSASITGLVVPASATDVVVLTGSSSKIVRITNIGISGTTSAGTGISFNMSFIKRSSADTSGTSTSPTVVAYDSTNPAATAVMKAYTANPTLGSTVGTIFAGRISFPTNGATGGSSDVNQYPFGNRPAGAIVLRGTSEQLAINFGGVTITSPLVTAFIEWTEE
jgi:hypothetical protein